jgi:hypothetical protein
MVAKEMVLDGQLNSNKDYNTTNNNIPNKDFPNPINTNGLVGLGGVGEVKKVLAIKNMPDSSHAFLQPNTVLVNTFDQVVGIGGLSAGMSNIRGGSTDKGFSMQSRPKFVMYGIAGHKMYSSRLPAYDANSRENNNLLTNIGNLPREVIIYFCFIYAYYFLKEC